MSCPFCKCFHARGAPCREEDVLAAGHSLDSFRREGEGVTPREVKVDALFSGDAIAAAARLLEFAFPSDWEALVGDSKARFDLAHDMLRKAVTAAHEADPRKRSTLTDEDWSA